ncbi:MAG TPA: serine/threonine-protein kinase [Pyrinomonadaceae bacterium]|nr:serine/threonine-protein kinase [Pyrinomonadaceae bacterium]
MSFDSIDDSRFVPGTILADRYRIVGLLGKGGMGEVFRADDLKLGQPVALKFLPEHLLSDGAALARFHREVRVARQVSHKNVCRVYDIGEVDGRHFLSMEFIKGEELSSLLRRIGRLPQDKAVQIARQICAGLAAAHDVGFLHRDLKPANVMIDEHGNARILDFGLGGLTEEFGADEMRAGTPAYMSPEQIEAKEQTVRSDIYSLGLVLYELFTGKRAFEAPTLGDLVKLRRSDTSPTTPSEIVKDLDPAIERVIDRCLQKNPAQRPVSALQVAAALPGGDPIAAALAAGETPSPEMVAAAPKEGALRPAVAVAIMASFLVGLAFVITFANKAVLFGYAPLNKSPDVLREHAREVIRAAGVTAPATDHTYWFAESTRPLQYLPRDGTRRERLQQLKDGQPAVIHYLYRQSPSYLGAFDYFGDTWKNPPPIISGMAGVRLDTQGRLLEFYAVPPQVDPVSSSKFSEQRGSSPTVREGAQAEPSNSNVENRSSKPETQVDWSPLFRAAGFNLASFKPTTSQWAPLYTHDERAAWEGVFPEQPELPIRVEAAAYRGKPVHFEVVAPWDGPERQQPSGLPTRIKALFTILLSVFVLMLVGSSLLAIRNLRQGRGDRKGAWRLGVFMFIVTLLMRIFSAHHVPTFDEFGTILNALQDSLFAAAFLWLVYIALEPFVRRRWPHRIVSWTRLLNGDYRDPLVGRDVLVGALLGICGSVWQIGFYFLRSSIGDPGLAPIAEPSSVQLGMGYFLPALSGQLSSSLLSAFQLLFLVLLLSLLLRRDWIGFLVGWIVLASALSFLWGAALPNWISASVSAAMLVFALYRFGFVAAVSAILVIHIYVQFPVTPHLTAWYATGLVIDLLLVLAMVGYAFYVSLADQRVFGGRLFEEG